MKLQIYFLSIFILFLSACTDSNTMHIAGSQTVFPIIAQAAEQFKQSNPDINITITAGGSQHGIRQIGENEVQIGMTSRDATWEEKDQYPNVDFQHHAIAKDAVVPAVSAQISARGIRALSLQQIRDIYTGKITNWKTFRGPDRDIHVIDADKSSGTRHIFMARILRDRQAEAAGADQVITSDEDRLKAITQSNSAIGMLPRKLLNRTIRGIGIVVSGGVIIPTDEQIQTNRYPISRELYLITNGSPSGNTKKFIDFLLSSEGQKIVKTTGYVPLTSQ